jgi:hypothetical protein
MLVRLGHILYWGTSGIGALTFVTLVAFGLFLQRLELGARMGAVALGVIGGLAWWLLGWACRYVLAGR